MNSHSKVADEKHLGKSQMSGISLYIVAAIFARIATGGAAIAVIILARSIGADGTMAGIFAACMTVPHVLGPLYGKWLDNAKEPLLIIAVACTLFVVTFQLVILSLSWDRLWLTISLLLICGSCSSFMMGGLSTQLGHFIDNNISARRKAQSWDNATYGFGLTLGPLLIGLITTHYSITFSISILMSIPLLTTVILVYLSGIISHIKIVSHRKIVISRNPHSNKMSESATGIANVIAIITHSIPLKRTLTMTAGAAFAVAALPVLAVYFSEAWLQQRESGAWLVTLYGIGSLLGSGLLVLNPLKGEALALLRNVGIFLFLSLVPLVFSQSFNASLAFYGLCGLINAIFFAATLAARTEYAPLEGAAQIYMWVAAAKITAASLGAFVAGLLVDFSIKLPLLVSIAVLGLCLFICFWQNKKEALSETVKS